MNNRTRRFVIPIVLKWYADNARDLPWRVTLDPYAIWVSEIMLQQTQVKTVIPYWDRWMRALPTIADLAAAAPDTIHKLWEGLGYYTRVRNMQKAAVQIMTQHRGEFPREHAAILELPGIGRYTAGAISSIAFNQPQPILDGNVIRVLTRLFGITKNPKDKSTNAQLWQLAQQLVTTAHAQDAKHGAQALYPRPLGGEGRGEGVNRVQTAGACSTLNQSLMELGALICTPKQPKCPECPVRKYCFALATNRVYLIPNLGPRIAATERHFIAFVIEHRGKFLVRQRPAGQVNAHLWEFPNLEVTSFDLSDKNFDAAKLAYKYLGLRLNNLSELHTIRHTITRYRITLRAFRAALSHSALRIPHSALVSLSFAELEPLAFTSAHRKILTFLQTISN